MARLRPPFLLAGLLLVAPACGGGATGTAPGTARALAYTAPEVTSSWRLTLNPSSTASQCGLDLSPPPDVSGLGVTLVLTVDGTRARWTGDVASIPYQGALVRKVSLEGDSLRILLCLRSPNRPFAYGGAPVLTATLALVPGAPPGPVALTVAQAGHLRAAQALPDPITVATGSLEVR